MIIKQTNNETKTITMTVNPDLNLISDIYETILAPGKWKSVLDRFADHSRAKSSVLLVTNDSIHDYSCIAYSKHWTRRNIIEYGRHFYDEEMQVFRLIAEKSVHQFVSDTEIVEDVDDYLSRPVNQWMRETLGIANRSGCGLHVHRAWTGVITLQYDNQHGTVTQADKQRADPYVSHFARAVEINRSLSVLKQQYNAVLAALDHFMIAVMIIDPHGNVVLENSTAQELLEDNDGLGINSNRKLVTPDSQEQSQLDQSLKQVLETAVAQDNTAMTVNVFKRPSGKDPYVLELSPLCDPNNDIDTNFRGAIGFVIDPSQGRRIDTRGIQQIYGLTKTEAIVCKLLAEGHSTQDMADLRNVSLETIRSQIKTIMEKTSTNSRIDLVRLALTVNPPVDIQ